MKPLFCRIPSKLYQRISRAATANDLKLVAVVRQALELWLKENNGMTPAHTTDLPPSLQITVCDKCLPASCWQGNFMCDDARLAGVVNLPVKRLLALKREHPDHWEHDPLAVEWRRTGKQ